MVKRVPKKGTVKLITIDPELRPIIFYDGKFYLSIEVFSDKVFSEILARDIPMVRFEGISDEPHVSLDDVLPILKSYHPEEKLQHFINYLKEVIKDE